ncbi:MULTISPECIES: putative hydroxymethylpyrimidine transporter CytX [Pelosinus]|uniref:Hydroxymethylpyrimidine transporter CytX n=1 Tax=Pelosinus fermentans B4 TaxID=1149862 RepID=I8RNA8_9FIRM|nr:MULTISPECIES: putative hydroxymethylpyrimidine transporter CytX [Pelosinus]EIW20535.1 hydroxymethylpyrimidine transporter CytX [Pelosinus fermentans B4]EIW25750.1 hydroxymethylpyrimidine transporter CytX [Pelosinus fermentans A11]OAM93474.1 hydroxymethylpyrimidine transporter CytX [Pelosinus fermentans DSM 17108]SDQ79121.1 putative hydroxymethylpyrimidine transporter CytX [Pelosinus fermentans]
MTNETNNTLGFKHFLFLWFGAAVSIAEILTGGLLAPLGFQSGVMAIVIGHVVGVIILVLGGIIGTQERIPAIVSTRISFGVYGSYLFSVLNVLQLVGWTAVMIIAAARSANEISKMLWGMDQLSLWSMGIGGLVLLWIALGREDGLKKVNMAAVFLLFGITVLLSNVVFKDSTALNAPPMGGMSFGEALELSIIMPLSWLPLIADYTRFAKSKTSAALGSGLGYFIGSCWMYLIGLGAAIIAGNPEPSAMMLAANLGLSALGIIVLATVTTTFLDAYSAGISFTNIFPKLDEKRIALFMTVIGTGIALWVNIEQYENFLLAIGSVFAPLFAVLLTEYFIIKNRQLRPDLLVNWSALAVWALGVIMYHQFITMEFVLGATMPVLLLTSLLYKIIWGYTKEWKSCKKYPTAS